MDSQSVMKNELKGSTYSQADGDKAIVAKTTTKTVGRPALKSIHFHTSLHAYEILCCNLAALDCSLVLSVLCCSLALLISCLLSCSYFPSQLSVLLKSVSSVLCHSFGILAASRWQS